PNNLLGGTVSIIAGAPRTFAILGTGGLPATGVGSVLATLAADGTAGTSIRGYNPDTGAPATPTLKLPGSTGSVTTAGTGSAADTIAIAADAAANIRLDTLGYLIATPEADAGATYAPLPLATLADSISGLRLTSPVTTTDQAVPTGDAGGAFAGIPRDA